MRFFSLVFLIQFYTTSSGQSFVNDPSEDEFIFNPKLLSINNVKSIKAIYSYKYDLAPILQSKERVIYDFNASGELKFKTEIRDYGIRTDTLKTEYFRNKDGQLTMTVKMDARFIYIDLQNYKGGNLILHQFYQMKKTSNWNAQLSDVNLIWSDSLIQKNDLILVKNRYGKKYKEHRISKNSIGEIIQEDIYDQSGKLTSSCRYEYVDKQIRDIEVISYSTNVYAWKKEMIYDQNGLSEIKYFKENKLKYIRKLSYNKLGLPELDLNRDENMRKMTIIKFEYSYL